MPDLVLKGSSEAVPRPFSLGRVQILAVASVLALVLLLAASLIWSPLMEQYLLSVTAPPLEAKFGFKATYVDTPDTEGYKCRSFQLTELSKGGTFERAGFLVGDILAMEVCAFHGCYAKAEYFLNELRRVEGGSAVGFWVGRREEHGYSRRTVVVAPTAGKP